MSVSVITPIFAKIILGVTSACLIFSIAFLRASLEPWTSDLIIIASSFGAELLSNADSLLAKIDGACFDLFSSILYLFISFAFSSESTTTNGSMIADDNYIYFSGRYMDGSSSSSTDGIAKYSVNGDLVTTNDNQSIRQIAFNPDNTSEIYGFGQFGDPKINFRLCVCEFLNFDQNRDHQNCVFFTSEKW